MGSLRSLRSLRKKEEVPLSLAADQFQQLVDAVYNGTVAELKAVLEAGANPNGGAKYGFNPLTPTCWQGMITKVILLLKHGADVNQRASNGYPINYAARRGDRKGLRILEILLDWGADVNATYPRHTGTALHTAVRNLDARSVELLLERGVDITTRDGEGKTALDLVEDNDSWRAATIKELLIKKTS